ncbi:MAG: hypothetical protein J5I62_07600 [Flavobacteriales bacterium]|nr:hypothetical protein [Flavobacteriales bacterium]
MKRHLSTLGVLHYVYGAFICLIGLGMLSLVILGGFLNNAWIQGGMGDVPPRMVGVFLGALGWILFAVVETQGILNLISGRMIDRRRNRTFTQVVAALNCLNIPFGIALGIFTFVVVADPEVRAEYGLAG